jgi:hypothetical protein
VPIGVKGPQQKWEVHPPQATGAGGGLQRIEESLLKKGFKYDEATGEMTIVPGGPADKQHDPNSRLERGYRYNESGDAEPIPGSKADVITREEYAADTSSVDRIEDTFDRVGFAVDELLKNDNGLRWITGYTGYAPDWVSQDKKDASIKLEELKGKIFVQAIDSLKSASANGSTGFGQLTEREGDKIQASIANLKEAQGYEQMVAALAEIKSVVDA